MTAIGRYAVPITDTDILPIRATSLTDRQRLVRRIFSAQFQPISAGAPLTHAD